MECPILFSAPHIFLTLSYRCQVIKVKLSVFDFFCPLTLFFRSLFCMSSCKILSLCSKAVHWNQTWWYTSRLSSARLSSPPSTAQVFCSAQLATPVNDFHESPELRNSWCLTSWHEEGCFSLVFRRWCQSSRLHENRMSSNLDEGILDTSVV